MVSTVSSAYLDERSILSGPGLVLGFFSGALVAGGLFRSGLLLVLTLIGILVLADCIFSKTRAEQHHGTVMVAAIFGALAEVLLATATADPPLLLLAFFALMLYYSASWLKVRLAPKRAGAGRGQEKALPPKTAEPSTT